MARRRWRRTGLFRERCLLLLITLTAAHTLRAAEPGTGPGALALLEPASDEFHFVVVGDTQFDDPAAANRLYDDLRWLRPAFVVQVGDMIDGYQSAATLRAQWLRFRQQIAPIAAAGIPFLPVAGNHDVFGADKTPDPLSLEVYEQQWGRAHYDFRYRNTHLLMLNSDPVNLPNSIDAAQLEWLEARLRAAQDATHRLVFLHRPPAFLKMRDRLTELFRRYGVSHVFYGHHHHYHYRKDDGITYVMTNGSGSSGTTLDAAGSFQHLLQVSVRDQELTYAVIRADSIEAPDYAVPEDNYDLFALRRALSSLNPLLTEATQDRGDPWLRYRTTLDITNPSGRAVTLHLDCGSEDERFAFAPAQLAPVTVAARATRTLALEVRQRSAGRSESEPRCRAQFVYQVASGRWYPQSVEFLLRLPETRP
ncbi:MAG: metallophosphoesterase [Pseudomonadota bacterium]